jgi:hypothetical protein
MEVRLIARMAFSCDDLAGTFLIKQWAGTILRWHTDLEIFVWFASGGLHAKHY